MTETAAAVSQRIRLNNFDLLRLAAASQVMIIHALQHLDVPLGRAGTLIRDLLVYFPGVPIFFFMSGFLISLSFDRNPDLAIYARNRLLRIYPALWLCLVVSLAVVTALGYWPRSGVTAPAMAIWLAAQATIAQFYNPGFLRDFGVGVLNGSLWTITVELQFYVVLPLLLMAIARFNRRTQTMILIALIVAGAAIDEYFVRLITDGNEPLPVKLFGVTVIPYLHMFLIGVVIQRNLEVLWPLIAGKGLHWLALYLLIAVPLTVYLGFRPGSVHPTAVAVLLLAFAAVGCAFTAPWLSHALLRGNDISYGTYIYHMVLVNAAIELALPPGLRTFALVCAATLAAAAVSWVVLEKPALRAKQRALRPVGT